MSGDKIRKNQRAEVLLFPLTLRDDFKDEVLVLRQKYRIPLTGFKTRMDTEKWLIAKGLYGKVTTVRKGRKIVLSKNLGFKFSYRTALLSILKKYKQPPLPGLINALESYVLGDGSFKITKGATNVCCLLEIPEEKEMKKTGRRFIKLLIYDTADHAGIRKYLDDQWPTIKQLLGTDRKRIKGPMHSDLIQEIFKLKKLPVEALRRLAKLEKSGRGPRYGKYTLIAKILKLTGDKERVRKLISQHDKK